MTTERIDIEAKANTKHAEKNLKKLYQNINSLGSVAKKFNAILAKTNAKAVQSLFQDFNTGTKKASKGMSGFTDWLKKGQKATIGFNGAALSTLFFGMELNRVFSMALKSIFDGYKKIMPESGAFNKATTKLSANWEFFKFQLADAMAKSPLFLKMIAFVITLVNWFKALPQPVKTFIGALMGVLAVLGLFMMYISIIKLGFAGIVDGMAAASKTASGFTWGSLAKPALILGVVAAFYTLNKALDTFHKYSKTGKKKWDLFKNSLSGVAKSIIEPIAKGFGAVGFTINGANELMIVLGAVWQNVLTSVGMMLNALVAILRSVFNIITIIIRAVWGLAKALWSLNTLDFAGAMSAWYEFKSGLMTDISDINDAFTRSQQNFNKMSKSIVTGQDIKTALTEYRTSLKVESLSPNQSGQTINNNTTVFVTLDQAVADGVISQEERDIALGVTGH